MVRLFYFLIICHVSGYQQSCQLSLTKHVIFKTTVRILNTQPLGSLSNDEGDTKDDPQPNLYFTSEIANCLDLFSAPKTCAGHICNNMQRSIPNGIRGLSHRGSCSSDYGHFTFLFFRVEKLNSLNLLVDDVLVAIVFTVMVGQWLGMRERSDPVLKDQQPRVSWESLAV